jgi:hypothetical protein
MIDQVSGESWSVVWGNSCRQPYTRVRVRLCPGKACEAHRTRETVQEIGDLEALGDGLPFKEKAMGGASPGPIRPMYAQANMERPSC